MKTFYQFFLLEQVVWIPIVTCLIRYKRITPTYQPLFMYLIARAVLELTANLVVIFMPSLFPGNAPFYNLIFLVEALLITWQLYNFYAFRRNKNVYISVQLFWLLLWAVDNFYIGSFNAFNLAFHTAYSALLLFFITTLIGKFAFSKEQPVYRSTNFLICIAFALWFIYSIFYAFSKYLVAQNKQLLQVSNEIITFMEFAEVLLYLMIAWAICRLPPKRNLRSI